MKERINHYMRSYACAALILVLLSWSGSRGLAGSAPAVPEASALVGKIRPALVVLVSLDRHGKAKSFGTGFFISKDGMLVTARHIAQAERNLVALTQDGQKFPVTGFIGEDRDYDIAVLKTQRRECAHLVLARQALPETNQWTALVSSQDAVAPACSTGVVANVISLPGLFAAIATTVSVKAGQSGSPLLNADGEVIGVVPYVSPTQSATASPIGSIQGIMTRAGASAPAEFSKRPSNGSSLPLIFDADFKPAIEDFRGSRWREAERRLKRVVKRFPESPFTLTALAMVQIRSGRIGKGLASAERAQRLRPDSAMPYLLKGVCLVTQGRLSEGLAPVRKALEIGLPDHDTTTSAWELVARIEKSLGRNKQAEEALARLEELDPKQGAQLRDELNGNKISARSGK